MAEQSRYEDIATVKATIHGRSRNLFDLRDEIFPQDLGDDYLLDTESTEGEEWDALVLGLAHEEGADEGDWWLLYRLNFLLANDPFEFPGGQSIVCPTAEKLMRLLEPKVNKTV